MRRSASSAFKMNTTRPSSGPGLRRVERAQPHISVTTRHRYAIAYKYRWQCDASHCAKMCVSSPTPRMLTAVTAATRVRSTQRVRSVDVGARSSRSTGPSSVRMSARCVCTSVYEVCRSEGGARPPRPRPQACASARLVASPSRPCSDCGVSVASRGQCALAAPRTRHARAPARPPRTSALHGPR